MGSSLTEEGVRWTWRASDPFRLLPGPWVYLVYSSYSASKTFPGFLFASFCHWLASIKPPGKGQSTEGTRKQWVERIPCGCEIQVNKLPHQLLSLLWKGGLCVLVLSYVGP